MRNMHINRRLLVHRIRLALSLAAVAVVLVVCTAVAIGAVTGGEPVHVVDGDQSYEFKLSRQGLDAILSQAESMGLEPLGAMDTAEFSEDGATVIVRRGVEVYLSLSETGETNQVPAYLGETVEELLKENEIELEDGDLVEPNLEMVIAAPLTVSVRRACQVTVTADGRTTTLAMVGGTVADAIEQAGVKLGENDSCNYGLDEPLFNKMPLRILRMVGIAVTADGKTKEYQVAALTVEDALEKCGIELGEDDRLNVKREAPVKSGMNIVVKRVKIRQEVETEDIPFKTKYEYTDELPSGKKSVLSAGKEGKKELTYEAVYVEGKLESRSLASEKVVSQPIDEMVMQGVGYSTTAPTLDYEEDDTVSRETPSPTKAPLENDFTGENYQPGTSYKPGTSGGGAGTFIDDGGNEVSYHKVITGTCTAYCIPGGTTSVGLTAARGVIAVDPEIIPYGTRMYVASPDGSIIYGYGVAGDTGGACLAGDIIADLCYDTIDECSIIGRREMVLYILD